MLTLFLIFILLFAALFLLTYKKGRPTGNYACGEKIQSKTISHENFYKTFYSLFPRTFRALEKMHSEDLSSYIYYLLLTLSLLLLVVIAAWL